MRDQILVAYASRVGSTKEVAAAIAATLREKGVELDLRPINDVQHIGTYSAVILGSAIRFGKVLPEMQRFVEAHRVQLKQLPVAYFVVCMTMEEVTQTNQATARAYLDSLIALVPAVDVALFAGEVNLKNLAPALRMLVNAMHAPQGDFRDWDRIRGWAAELSASLLKHQSQVS
jgi:menaquinone-dependent protoporphyrinogen oxidase